MAPGILQLGVSILFLRFCYQLKIGKASFGGPADFATRLHKAAENWTATGDLAFMNQWTYKLGEEVLTPFGRQQLFDLGISMRLKYGFLLKNFTETNTIPVFRTESQYVALK